MLDNRYLTFLELSKELNYTRTAEKMSLTQPTVTKHIQGIEEDLKTKLFCYQNKTLTLSPDGEYLVKELSNIVEQIDKIKHNLCRLSHLEALKIGASHTIGEYFIPKYTQILIQDLHQLHYNIIIENHSILLNKLNKHEIDCALISGPLEKNDNYCEIEFYFDEILLICNRQHPLANQTVSISDLQNENFVLRETDSGIYQSLDYQLKAQQYSIDIFKKVSHIGNISLISHIIHQQNKLGFFYRSTIESDLIAGKVSQIHLADVNLIQKFVLLYNPYLIDKATLEPLIYLLTN